MDMVKLFASTVIAASLAGCGGTGDTGLGGSTTQIGYGATLEQAETAFDELVTSVLDIKLADGATTYANLPTGPLSFNGIISGGPGEDGTGDFTHYADLNLSTDFNTVTGSVTNFTTNVGNFNNPTGNITISGAVTDNAGVATIEFSGSGSLVGAGVVAEYSISTTDGNFLGSNGAAIEGGQESEFAWTAGRAGTEDSNGDWYAKLP